MSPNWNGTQNGDPILVWGSPYQYGDSFKIGTSPNRFGSHSNLGSNIRAKLCNEYMVEINDQNKEWMVVAPRDRRWPKDNNREGDESFIVSREEREEGEDKDSDESCSIDFVNGLEGL